MRVELVETLRQPEYTGENRCEPCTILNLVLAALLGSVVARRSRLGGWVAVVVSVGLIYLRGYLVPGTPTLTKRHLPPAVLRWFGKEPELETRSGLGDGTTGSTDGTTESTDGTTGPSRETSAASEETVGAIDPHDYLLAEGVVEPCEDRDDLCLVDGFRTAWNDEIADLADDEVDTSEMVSILGIETDAAECEIEQYGDAWRVVADSRTLGQWPSRGAFLADVGAAHVLDEWSEQWGDLPPTQRGPVLNGLRLFLDQCPDGTGPVSMNQETVESCCSSHQVLTVSCDETGERLFEQRISEV